MAVGRTISASFLTDLDTQVIELCNSISELISENIKEEKLKIDFIDKYGKISNTRDAGSGRGGGKLQRDALCTRGKGGNAPFSNRNLRWHPLVIAEKNIDFAKEIERIEIDAEQTLLFIVKQNEEEIKIPAEKVHELNERYVVLPKHWIEHIDTLKHWKDEWMQNRCVIPAYEACNWWDAVETYSVLGIAVAVEYYNVDFSELLNRVNEILQNQNIDTDIMLPSELFPSKKHEFITCPVCQLPISNKLHQFRKENRPETWQPSWRKSKKTEGDDGSNQILHINPLTEENIGHRVDNVRFGHRWCNVAMTDHSLDETLNFMEFIIKAHNRYN